MCSRVGRSWQAELIVVGAVYDFGMYGWWQSFEHFSFPGSSPIATSEDLARVEKHARKRWPVPTKKPVIGSWQESDWIVGYRVDPDRLHRQSDSQRHKYERARRGGSRGNLGAVPTEAELFIETIDLDEVSIKEADRSHEDLLDELPNLQRATVNGTRAPYKFVVLRWAIERARAGSPRIAAFRDVRTELRAALAPFKLGKSPTDPAYPWFALRSSNWWELPDAPPDATELTVARHNLRGGLSTSAFELVRADAAFARTALEELDRLINDETDSVAQTVEASGELKGPALVPVDNNIVERFEVSIELSPAERHRREAALQDRYQHHLIDLGHNVMTYRIPTASGAVLATDLFDVTADELIEVKSSIDRETLRLALGQILDYERFIRPKLRTLLVPERPAQEMVDLFSTLAIRVAWPHDDGFEMS